MWKEIPRKEKQMTFDKTSAGTKCTNVIMHKTWARNKSMLQLKLMNSQGFMKLSQKNLKGGVSYPLYFGFSICMYVCVNIV